MMDILFFAALLIYFAAALMQIIGTALNRPRFTAAARWGLGAALMLHTAFSVWWALRRAGCRWPTSLSLLPALRGQRR